MSSQSEARRSSRRRGRGCRELPGLGPVLVSALLWAPVCLAEQPFMGDAEEPEAEIEPPTYPLQTTDPDTRPKRPDTRVIVDQWYGSGGSAAAFLQVPVTDLFPNNITIEPAVKNPVAGDPEALARGRRYFNDYNCAGCHAPNGGGGMGISLSNSRFVYGSEPENIYLSILQGRPGGMPAWGGMLQDDMIWDLVTYIREISKEPAAPWGKTVSVEGFTIEQVPAEFMDSLHPWEHTQPFSYGQPPFEKVKGSPPLETPAK